MAVLIAWGNKNMNFFSDITNNLTATSSPVGAQSRNMFDDYYKPVFEDFPDDDGDNGSDLMMILNYIHTSK